MSYVGYSHMVVLMSTCDRNCSLMIFNPLCTDAQERRAQHTRCGSRTSAGGSQQGDGRGMLFRAFAFLFLPDLF